MFKKPIIINIIMNMKNILKIKFSPGPPPSPYV